MNAISSYQDHEAVARQERERADVEERKRLEAEAARSESERARRAAEQELESVRTTAQTQESRISTLEAQQNALIGELAKLKADGAERDQREIGLREAASESERGSKHRRDWMLFCSLCVIPCVPLLYLDQLWMLTAILSVVVVSLLWVALAAETPRISLGILSLIVATAALIAGIAQNWPAVRSAMVSWGVVAQPPDRLPPQRQARHPGVEPGRYMEQDSKAPHRDDRRPMRQ